MCRLVTISFALSLLTHAGIAEAKEPQQEWMQFMKGKWSYEYPAFQAKGEVTYRLAANRNAVIARGTEEDDTWVELIGWRGDKKMLVFTGYAAKKGNYWDTECTNVSKDEVSGPSVGVLPDGRACKGSVTLKRVGEDKFEVHLNLKTDDEVVKDVGVFTRQAE